MEDDEKTNAVMNAVNDKITVIRYSKWDRRVNIFIGVGVILNLILTLFIVPWSHILW